LYGCTNDSLNLPFLHVLTATRASEEGQRLRHPVEGGCACGPGPSVSPATARFVLGITVPCGAEGAAKWLSRAFVATHRLDHACCWTGASPAPGADHVSAVSPEVGNVAAARCYPYRLGCDLVFLGSHSQRRRPDLFARAA